MAAFIEIHIARDIGDSIDEAGKCSHAAEPQVPFSMCSMAFAELEAFAGEAAGRLETFPIGIVASEVADFEFIADHLDAIEAVMPLRHGDKNTILYTFAKAHRLGLRLLVKAASPYVGLCNGLSGVCGVTVLVV